MEYKEYEALVKIEFERLVKEFRKTDLYKEAITKSVEEQEAMRTMILKTAGFIVAANNIEALKERSF